MREAIDDPRRLTMEVIEGYVSAFPYQVRRIACQAVVRADAPIPGKVSVIIGGTGGPEPLFMGYLGPGMADGCPIGQDRVAASPDVVLDATRGASGGAGVVYICGNGSAEAGNFELAAVDAAEEGVRIETVLVGDDIDSAPSGEMEKRRGIAGAFFVFKCAGARAEERATLEEVYAAASKASSNTRSVAWIEPEAGVRAEAVTEEAVRRIVDDLPFRAGDEVAVLVSRSGAIPPFAPYLVFRRAARLLTASGIEIHRTYVGEYGASSDIPAVSITLMRLDDELRRLVDAPASCPCFAQ